jgi:hypothetical protein
MFFRSRKATAAPTQLPVPLDTWFLDPTSAANLRVLLQDPTLQKAVATLQALANPLHASLKGSAEEVSRSYAWLAGYHDFFRDLNRLTKVPVNAPSASGNDDLESWGYINTPQKPSTFPTLEPEE